MLGKSSTFALDLGATPLSLQAPSQLCHPTHKCDASHTASHALLPCTGNEQGFKLHTLDHETGQVGLLQMKRKKEKGYAGSEQHHPDEVSNAHCREEAVRSKEPNLLHTQCNTHAIHYTPL